MVDSNAPPTALDRTQMVGVQSIPTCSHRSDAYRPCETSVRPLPNAALNGRRELLLEEVPAPCAAESCFVRKGRVLSDMTILDWWFRLVNDVLVAELLQPGQD